MSAEEIERLGRLRRDGLITEGEFEELKRRQLRRVPTVRKGWIIGVSAFLIAILSIWYLFSEQFDSPRSVTTTESPEAGYKEPVLESDIIQNDSGKDELLAKDTVEGDGYWNPETYSSAEQACIGHWAGENGSAFYLNLSDRLIDLTSGNGERVVSAYHSDEDSIVFAQGNVEFWITCSGDKAREWNTYSEEPFVYMRVKN